MQKKNIIFRINLVILVIFLFVGGRIIFSINGRGESDMTSVSLINDLTNQPYCTVSLDTDFIHSITENLSLIIINEYNESKGEIAKGRAFGSKGEQKAAEILHENFSNMGLLPIKKNIDDKPISGILAKRIEILDYQLTIYDSANVTNITVFSLPQRSIFGLRWRFWNVTHNFNYTGLKIKTDHPPIAKDCEDYVILKRNEDDKNFTQSSNGIRGWIEKFLEYFMHPHWVGQIFVDSNNDTCNMWMPGKPVPIFSINKTIGNTIDVDNDRIQFNLKQRLNHSVQSCNVIGEIPGKDPRKTVIVCCLYDSWWCQGAGDSAVGMGIVMAIAKYFKELKTMCNIIPNYTIKFIGFCGEEVGGRGAQYYVQTHPFERILYVIDLNQLGMDQINPKLTLEVLANNKEFLDCIWNVVKRTDYMNRTGNRYNITKIYDRRGHLSDDRIFATQRPFCKTVCFLKNGKWIYHHRDGLNHREGDVLTHIDWNDVNVTAEMILNVTISLTLDENEMGNQQCCIYPKLLCCSNEYKPYLSDIIRRYFFYPN